MIEHDYSARGICTQDRFAVYKSAERQVEGLEIHLLGGEGEVIELVKDVKCKVPPGKVAYEIKATKRECVSAFDQLINKSP